MAAPPNQSAATAIDLGTLPATVTQDVSDGAINYTVWYTVTPTADDYVINVFPFGGTIGSGYQPSLSVFTGTGATPYLTNLTNVGANRAAQFFTTPGQTLWFRLATNNPALLPAILTLDVQRHTPAAFVTGDLLINDDDDHFQAGIVKGDTTDVRTAMRRFIGPPFASGETIARLPDGTLLINNSQTGEQWLYAPDLTRLAVVAIDPVSAEDEVSALANQGTQFFVAEPSGTNFLIHLSSVSAAGSVGPTTWSPTGITQPEALAIAPDASIAYYATSLGLDGQNARALKRWDLLTDTALPDLVPAAGDANIVRMLMLANGTLVVIRSAGNSGTAIRAEIVDTTTGVTLRSIDFSAYASTADPRLALALEDPTAFWAWIKLGAGPTTTGVSRFLQLRTADLAILQTRDVQQYEKGRYQGDVVADPTRFGISESCDFVLLGVGVTASGCIPTWPTPPATGQGCVPSWTP